MIKAYGTRQTAHSERFAEQVVRDLVREARRKAHGEVPEGIIGLVQG